MSAARRPHPARSIHQTRSSRWPPTIAPDVASVLIRLLGAPRVGDPSAIPQHPLPGYEDVRGRLSNQRLTAQSAGYALRLGLEVAHGTDRTFGGTGPSSHACLSRWYTACVCSSPERVVGGFFTSEFVQESRDDAPLVLVRPLHSIRTATKPRSHLHIRRGGASKFRPTFASSRMACHD